MAQRPLSNLQITGRVTLVCDKYARITYLTPDCRRLTGWSVGDLAAVYCCESRDVCKAEPLAAEVVHKDVTIECGECLVIAADGDRLYAMIVAYPRLGPDGHTVGATLVLSSIVTADERRAKKITDVLVGLSGLSELQIHLKLLAALLGSLDEIIGVTDVQGRILFVNETLLRRTGYSDSNVKGRLARVLFSPGNRRNLWDEMLAASLAGGWRGEVIGLASTGEEIPADLSITPVPGANGRPIALLGVARDLTEMRRAEKAKREAEHRYTALVESAQDCIVTTDREHRFVTIAGSILPKHGLNPSDLVGKTWFDIADNPAEAQKCIDVQDQVFSDGQPRRFEHLLTIHQQPVVLSAVVSPLKDESDAIDRLLGVAQDVTERWEAELRATQAQAAKIRFYRDTVFAVTGGKLILIDPKDCETLCTPADASFPIERSPDLAKVRRLIQDTAERLNLSEAAASDLISAAHEAASNAVKHAGGGVVRMVIEDDRIRVCVQDHGPGISDRILPRAALMPGFSTKPSLGAGYTLMLLLADRIYLATDHTGTQVAVEVEFAHQHRVVHLPSLLLSAESL